MVIKVQVTYDKVTPESAEHGDFSDHGFWEPGGWEYSIADDDFYTRSEQVGREQALADMTPEPEEFDSVDNAVEWISGYGPFEASCAPVCPNGHCWVTQADGDEDYGTGETTRLSFHITASNQAWAQIVQELTE